MVTLSSGALLAFVVTHWMVTMWIVGGVGSFALPFALAATARRGKPTAGPAPGSLVFRYTAFMRWGSICMALGAFIGMTVMAIVHPPKDQDETVAIIMLYLVSAVLTGALVWECVRFRLVVDPVGLECRSPWQRRRFIRWGDVVKVTFKNPLGYLDIRASDRRTIRVPAQVGGLAALLEACEERLTPSQLLSARRAYLFLGRPFPGE